MAQKYCFYLNNGINFHNSGITYCNKLWQDYSFQAYNKGFLPLFFERREIVLKRMKDGIPLDCCEKCMYLQEIDDKIEVDNKIKFIEIYHWQQCNCACFYCSNRESTKLKITTRRNQKGVINVLDNLKKLKKMGHLAENVEISMVGGEPTLLGEFSGLLKFFIKNNYKVNILSNGILYEKYISKALLANPSSSMCISLDCGSKELFKKIKGVDKFDDVVKNIKRYIKETKESSHRVMLKYILLKGVNDTKEEIDKWIDLCASLGVTNFFPSIEFCHSVRNAESSELTQEICDLYEYMKVRVKEVNPKFNVSTYDFVEEMIKKRSYKIK